MSRTGGGNLTRGHCGLSPDHLGSSSRLLYADPVPFYALILPLQKPTIRA